MLRESGNMSQNIALEAELPVENSSVKAPINYADKALGIMACFAITWGLLGLANLIFFMMSDAQSLSATYSPAQVTYIIDTPFWVRAGQTLGVAGMLTGSVYLLLRRKSAYHWFMWSLVGTLTVLLDSVIRGGFGTMGGMETGVNIAVTIVGIFLFWATYSAFQENQLHDE